MHDLGIFLQFFTFSQNFFNQFNKFYIDLFYDTGKPTKHELICDMHD